MDTYAIVASVLLQVITGRLGEEGGLLAALDGAMGEHPFEWTHFVHRSVLSVGLKRCELGVRFFAWPEGAASAWRPGSGKEKLCGHFEFGYISIHPFAGPKQADLTMLAESDFKASTFTSM